MHYGEIKNCDIANGEGVRVTLFVSGCTNHCKSCFQPQTWDFCYGQPFTEESEQEILKLLAPSYISGLTLLGGEPFEPENQRALLPFVRRVRARYPEKTIWAFSGFTLEELRQEGSRVTVTALCPGHVETNFDARAKVRRSIGGVSAKRVAQAGIEGMLRGKVVVLPGALMKMTYVGEKLLPESWMLKIAYRAQARKG